MGCSAERRERHSEDDRPGRRDDVRRDRLLSHHDRREGGTNGAIRRVPAAEVVRRVDEDPRPRRIPHGRSDFDLRAEERGVR